MNTFCALNIIDSTGELINKDNRPLMFIWDGVSDLWGQMKLDNDFVDFISDTLDFNNPQNYIKSYISSFTYSKQRGIEASYENKDITIQEMFPLNENIDLCEGYLSFITSHLYFLSFKTNPEKSETETVADFIRWKYDRIKTKYKDKLSNETFIQAILSFIQTNSEFNGLSKNNQDFLIETIKNIIQYE